MARHGDTRSPSPVGSLRSYSSKRSRRDDDRAERGYRDDGRNHHKRRSRSRSPESRRHRDREFDRDRAYRRRERSVERRHDERREEDNYYRSARRDRERERERERRRSRNRDERRRSRDRTDHSRRDDSKDRDQRRGDLAADMKKRRREDSREPPAKRDTLSSPRETSKLSAPVVQTAEEEKAAKLAKVEAWKKKLAEQQAKKKQEEQAARGSMTLLQEMDKKAAQSPLVTSPQSPLTPETASPAPYAGKFDPKAIAKRSLTGAVGSKVLGADIATPSMKNPVSSKVLANGTSPKPSSPKLAPSLKPKGNLSKFGLGAKAAGDQDTSKKNLDFEEDEDHNRKLEKLPNLPMVDDENGSAQADDDVADQDDDDDDVVMGDDDGNNEEAMAAARAAAEQRSRVERSEAAVTEKDSVQTTQISVPDQPESDEDPLDAFMSDLVSRPTKQTNFKTKSRTKQQNLEPEAMFSDEDVEMTAVDEDNPDSIMAAASANVKKKKKEIPAVNHAKVQYQTFRRNFYSEPIELSDMSEEDVVSLRMELDNIKVRGIDVPKPVRTWAQCGLGVQVHDVIKSLSYEAPTSIQSQAVPAIMSGRDVIGVAKTGSGKTIAFLLPMFRHIKDQRPLETQDGPVGLILSPTRELATQIHKECRPFLKALGLRAVCAYGGAPIKDQIADFKRGAEIVVCTPGRMIDLLAANSGRVTNLRRVTYVVLDEADRMFDMGFEPQVMKILGNIRPDRQTVLFSATFPRTMEALARKTLTKPVEIVVGGRSIVAPEITQIVEVRNEDTKFIRLLELLGKLYEDEQNEDDRALIFTDRQESADGLLRDLMKKGYPCMSIHGGKDQIDRDSTIQDFKAGVVPILIATSVAARGLDVKQLKLVVNYDAPNHLEDYVHRAGRTGRAGQKGVAVTFITEDQDRYSVDIAKALRQSGQPVPEPVQKLVDGFMEKVKAGKEKSYTSSGFSGKGLERLDQQRDADKARERKTYKTGDEGEDQEEKEEAEVADVKVGDDIFAKAASQIGARGQAANAPEASLPPSTSSTSGIPPGIDLDGVITVHKTERPAENQNGKANAQSQMDRVAAAVAGINQKLSKAGVMRSGVPIDNRGPDAGAFHATLEINDFPQKARWAVTNRTNVAKILESTGTSITTKGSFYATGKEPGPNENPKLYILVEGDTEVVVRDAMRELMRLLKEGTMSASEAEARAPGRYSVV